jgi:hypothetical protein
MLKRYKSLDLLPNAFQDRHLKIYLNCSVGNVITKRKSRATRRKHVRKHYMLNWKNKQKIK